MNNLDIVLIVALIIGFAIGYFKGLISQLSFGVGIVIGLLQAVLFYAPVAQRIQSATGWESIVCTAAAFIGIILAVILLFKIAGWIVSALLKAIHLAFMDRILGAVLSTVIAILLVVGITNAGNAIMPEIKLFSRTTQKESMLYNKVQNITLSILGELKKDIDEKTE
ncbi:MAG: CvpA family protein [Bacteroidaceae bacterium]|nr:CvpA family protein [Bacteroidaceae bacterium]